MNILNCNIWSLAKTHTIVIPVNMGWKADGRNVMGRGLAKQAAEKYPELPVWWGGVCQQLRWFTPVVPYHAESLIMFPTKKLSDPPSLTWRNKSDPELIICGLSQLRVWSYRFSRVALPLVGSGNGGLDPEVVLKWIKYEDFPSNVDVVDIKVPS